MKTNHTISLIQINDTHGYLDLHPEVFWEKGRAVYRQAGGYARLAALVKQIREKSEGSTVFLDNGDTLHGTYPLVQTQGKALVPILNRLGLDAMTAHWEFAYGPKTFQQRASELNYPMLALNIKQTETGELVFPAYRIKETGGIRVGIAGIASNIVDKVMPAEFSEGLTFDLGREELPGVIETLRSQEKVDLIIVLSHLGFPQDMQLAKDVPGIDVIASGHTHNRLHTPVRQGQTLIIQSGSHGSFVGHLDLTIENGCITNYQHRLIETAEEVVPDPEIDQLVRHALQPFQAVLSEVVGETAAPLDRSLNLEATMDTLLLNAISASMGTDLAFSNGWRYGAPILPGPVTMNDLHNIIPVNPPVSTVELTGQEIWDMIEENLEHTYSHNPYQQMGGYAKRARGLRSYFKVENPHPHRIQTLFIGEEEVKTGKTYLAAFVTEQGVPSKYGTNRQKHEIRAVDALREYLMRHSPVNIGYNNPFVLV